MLKLHISKIAMVIALFPVVNLIGIMPALAVDDFVEPEIRYEKAVANIKKSGLLLRSEISQATFANFDWVGKTALINLVCPVESSQSNVPACRKVLLQGIRDDALVVRDHSLRTMLTRASISEELKRDAATKIIADDRNYRRGKAFWIVTSAQKYLNSLSKGKQPND
jgi:hypothetical protein